MFANIVKTAVLLATLSGLIIFMGGMIGGTSGMHIAFIMALCMNGFMLFFSDKMVLRMYNAQPLDKTHYGYIYEIVEELTQQMHIPMPKLWLINAPHANAFATGRNPSHASIALTQNIITLLEPHELRGVIAHELGHIKNRDMLVVTIAATLAATISYMGSMIQHMLFWRALGGSNNRREQNPIGLLITAIIMPIFATMLQLAISRSREYLADESGAQYSRDPLALASALKKLQQQNEYQKMHKDIKHTSTASLFIVNPFLGNNWAHFFSTHPPTEQRVARLEKIFEKGF